MFAASKTASVSASAPDAQFNQVTMLLHGDGTNGAQNNTFVDSSTNNFTITRNGNTTQGSFSPYGSNWSNFNPDSSNGLGVATNTALNMGTGDFTVEAWVNTAKLPTTNAFQTSSGGYQCVFGTGPSNSSSGTQLYIGVTNLKFDISSDGGGPIDVAHNMVAGQWYHVAISKSSTTFKAFINGVLVQTATSSSSWVDGYNYGLMRAEPIGSYDGAWWYGYVSNFRLIKGTAIYTSSFTPSTTPLTAISGTSLLTCQSNRFIDNSSNNFTISVNNSPSVQRFNPFGTATVYSTSVIGGSAYMDGVGDSLSAANNSAFLFGSGDFTVECWINLDRASGTSSMITGIWDGLTNNPQAWLFYVSTTGSLNFIINLGTSGPNVTIFSGASNDILNNGWYHVAVTRSGNTWRKFINGVIAESTTNSSTIWAAVSATYYIGTFQNIDASSKPLRGYISDVRLVKGTAVYTSAFTPPTAPLTAITNTSLLTNFTNGAIFDNAMMNDLETVGNAQISTSVKKYGTGSLAFDGSGDYVQVPSSPINTNWTGNWTIEFWLYASASGAVYYLYKGSGLQIWGIDGTMKCSISATNNSTYFIDSNFGTISANTWTHISVVRNGNSYDGYVNGVKTNLGTSSSSANTGTEPLRVGSYAGGFGFTGYIDDLRITNGYARYTANFSVPTAAFPNTGPV